MNIYTLGYQGLNPEAYIQALLNFGVKIVVDVRENSWSQRPAYVGSTLMKSLAPVGIDYQHWKDLGNPSANRKTATTAPECMRRYRAYLRDHNDVLLRILAELRNAASSGNRVCLTCFEKEHGNCHRSVIVEELIRIEPELFPVHIEVEPSPKVPVKPRTSQWQASLSFP
jgi:uncharacterized protein (DUF488 family)